MHGRLIAIALAAVSAVAHAQPSPPDPGPPGQAPPGAPPGSADPGSTGAPTDPTGAAAAPAPVTGDAAPSSEVIGEVGDQAISAELGIAAGGRITPGGLRIAGQYLYRLSEQDWFDGGVSFTFGSGSAACFRDRENRVVCSHGLAEGTGIELMASARRMFAPQGAFTPFARVGVGLGLVRFDGDDVSGLTIPAHAGGGVRVAVAPAIAVVAEADLALGFGTFNRDIGSQLQFALTIAAGAEFRLR